MNFTHNCNIVPAACLLFCFCPSDTILGAKAIRIHAWEIPVSFSLDSLHPILSASTLSLESYQNFAADLFQSFLHPGKENRLKQNFKRAQDHDHNHGISLISAAYILAVVHRNLWQVSTTGFDKVLHLNDSEIDGNYIEIVDRLTHKNPVLNLSSKLYTPVKQFVMPKSIEILKTSVINVDTERLTEDMITSKFNDIILSETGGKIRENLIPEKPSFAVFNTNTLGMFANVVNFNGEWLYPFTSIGTKSFNRGSLKFLEATGVFSVLKNDDYTAVRVPFKDSGKALIFIKPSHAQGVRKLNQLNFKDVLNTASGKWESMSHNTTIKVQIPVFNYSSNTDFTQSLIMLGLKELFCGNENKKGNTLGFMIQTFYASVSENAFEIASATGSTLSNTQKEFNKICDLSSTRIQSRDLNSEDHKSLLEDQSTDNSNATSSTNNITTGNSTLTKNFTARSPGDVTHSEDETPIVFDTPFLWYFQDESLGLGPLLAGTIETATAHDIANAESGSTVGTTAIVTAAILTTGVIAAAVLTAAATTTTALASAIVTAFLLTAVAAATIFC